MATEFVELPLDDAAPLRFSKDTAGNIRMHQDGKIVALRSFDQWMDIFSAADNLEPT